jgi:Sigma-70 factor, region 1.1
MSGRGWLGRQSCAAENNRRKAEFNSSNATLLSSPVTPHAKKDHGEICGLVGPACHSCKKPLRTPAAKVCAECGLAKPLPIAQKDVAKVEHQRQALKALIKLGKDRGYLTRQELSEHLPEAIDAEQIESIAETFNEMGIKILRKSPDA